MNSTNDTIPCKEYIPFSEDIWKNQDRTAFILVICNCVAVLIIFIIYILEIVFIIRNFQTSYRKRNTLCVLGLAPVYALCALIGVLIPRASLLGDLVANCYYGLALYCLMNLIQDYLGAEKLIHHSDEIYLKLNTFPVCCCCCCLPTPKLTRKTYLLLLTMTYQVAVTRPVIAFLSLVLWSDGLYVPGQFTANNAFTYLQSLHLVTTTFAIWGLVIIQTAFKADLAQHIVGLKFMFLQLTLLGTSILNIIVGALVSKGVIPCNPFLPSAARAARVDNSCLVYWMLLVSLCGFVAYRRAPDGVVSGTRRYRKKRSVA